MDYRDVTFRLTDILGRHVRMSVPPFSRLLRSAATSRRRLRHVLPPWAAWAGPGRPSRLPEVYLAGRLHPLRPRSCRRSSCALIMSYCEVASLHIPRHPHWYRGFKAQDDVVRCTPSASTGSAVLTGSRECLCSTAGWSSTAPLSAPRDAVPIAATICTRPRNALSRRSAFPGEASLFIAGNMGAWRMAARQGAAKLRQAMRFVLRGHDGRTSLRVEGRSYARSRSASPCRVSATLRDPVLGPAERSCTAG